MIPPWSKTEYPVECPYKQKPPRAPRSCGLTFKVEILGPQGVIHKSIGPVEDHMEVIESLGSNVMLNSRTLFYGYDLIPKKRHVG